ncbi:MAG TPA: twin-arginine translocation signal domain-containing protein, partial [Chryseosolibacter sp.]
MKKNRRNFLKLAGMSAAGASILPGCNSGTTEDAKTGSKNWNSDPEWREVKYGGWSGPGVPD